MVGKTGIPLLLALSLFWATACGPVSPAPPEAESSPLQEPSAGSAAPAGDALSNTGEASPVSGEAATGVEPLAWGTNDENCIVPGLVITGDQTGAAPCGDAGYPAPASDNKQEEQAMPQETSPLEPGEPQVLDDATAQMAALAVDDLAQQLGIPSDEIEVREVHAVTWPDASLGCPQPDMMYAQMLQEGLLIRLSAGGEVYSYHSGGNQPPFLCEESMQMLPADLR